MWIGRWFGSRKLWSEGRADGLSARNTKQAFAVKLTVDWDVLVDDSVVEDVRVEEVRVEVERVNDVLEVCRRNK